MNDLHRTRTLTAHAFSPRDLQVLYFQLDAGGAVVFVEGGLEGEVEARADLQAGDGVNPRRSGKMLKPLTNKTIPLSPSESQL